MPVGFVEDGPAEDDRVEDDDEAVKYREGGPLPVSMNEDKNEDEDEDEDGDRNQAQEGCFEVKGGRADDVEGDKVS